MVAFHRFQEPRPLAHCRLRVSDDSVTVTQRQCVCDDVNTMKGRVPAVLGVCAAARMTTLAPAANCARAS